MSIEKMTKVFIVSLKSEEEKLRSLLMEKGIVHITDLKKSSMGQTGEGSQSERHFISIDTTEYDREISRFHYIIDFLNRFHPDGRGIISMFVATPTTFVQKKDVECAHNLDAVGLFDEIRDLDARMTETGRREEEMTHELNGLEPFRSIPFKPALIQDTQKTFSFIGRIGKEGYESFLKNADAFIDDLYIERIQEDQSSWLILVIGLMDRKEEVKGILSGCNFTPITLPPLDSTVADYCNELSKGLEKIRAEKGKMLSRIGELAPYKVSFKILLEECKSEKSLMEVQRNFLQTPHTIAIEGFIRSKDKKRFEKEIVSQCPNLHYTLSEPDPTDDVPVSLNNHSILKPVELLIEMFGYPTYSALDPTPFIFLTFLSFFGICFADVLYGGMLVFIAAWFIRKYSGERGLVRFMKLMLYAGISTMIFGFLTGSWGGDLVSTTYLAASNPLLKLRNSLTIIEPMGKPLAVLVITIFIGVFNQFYGIFLKAMTEIRRGNIKNAVYDCFLWYPYLIGAIILIASLFGKINPLLYRTGMFIFLGGAAGLVMTQGRGEATLIGKILTGIFSLYGIVGSYGLAGFIGDSLSYSRLLALGLTTSIVGMAFNIIAFLFKIPVIWPAVVALILILGHIFNFVMNIIGSFIHPTRLMFLEFFGRFYESGGTPFKPFAQRYDALEIVKRR